MSYEIIVLPFHGQGHLLPSTHLSLHLAHRNYKITLAIPSSLLSSLSSSLRNHPLIQIALLSPNLPPEPAPLLPHPRPGSHRHSPHHLFPPPHRTTGESFEALLSQICAPPDSRRPDCVVVDVMMSWAIDTCRKLNIPTVSFFTSGACSAAMEHAVWKVRAGSDKTGEILKLPGLPEDVALTLSNLTNNDPQLPPPHRPGGGTRPPPHLLGGGSQAPVGGAGGRPPPWIAETEGSIALLVNTSEDLERPFLEYVRNEAKKPIWAVGPLLPAQFWKSIDSVVRDGEDWPKRESNVTEAEVREWLDAKPRRSVIYVAFGTEVGPPKAELEELASALEESGRFFIWALQLRAGRPGPPGVDSGQDEETRFYHDGLSERVGGKGLVIQGWAPQLLILSHPSTAGFVSHVGWNSTLESLGRGVPVLCWPIRGDQHYNAKLVTGHLKAGFMVRAADGSGPVRKGDILRGIEKLMGDEEVRQGAARTREVLRHAFPGSWTASLDAFCNFLVSSSGENKTIFSSFV